MAVQKDPNVSIEELKTAMLKAFTEMFNGIAEIKKELAALTDHVTSMSAHFGVRTQEELAREARRSQEEARVVLKQLKEEIFEELVNRRMHHGSEIITVTPTTKLPVTRATPTVMGGYTDKRVFLDITPNEPYNAILQADGRHIFLVHEGEDIPPEHPISVTTAEFVEFLVARILVPKLYTIPTLVWGEHKIIPSSQGGTQS